MIEDLIEALRHLEPPLTAEELQDALWLAERFGSPGPKAEPPAPAPDPEARTPPAPSSGPSPSKGPEPTPPPERASPAPPPPEMGLFLADGAQAPPARTIRAPAPQAIPDALRLTRALRPLRARTDSATSTRLDEERTARQIAETGLWQPLLAPLPERRFELALVVDDSPSMPLWRQTVRELQTLLRHLGAFRNIGVWRLATEGDGAPRLLSGGGSHRTPDALVDPTGRLIVLLVSDCLGAAWQDGRIAGPLDRWGGSGPVAIVQPLPERLWRRSGVATHPVWMAASAPGAANARLEVGLRAGAGERPPGIAVPVLELTPRKLEPWALMVAQGHRRILGTALFTGSVCDEEAPPPEPAGLTPLDRVMRFRAASSPQAYRLAGHLAAAPLRPPVMRLVQHAMLPDSTTADLAEVQLSGLLRLVGPPGAPDSYDLAYEFHEGVRAVLMGGLRRSEAMSVLRNVWNVVKERFGSSLDFPALLGALEQDGSGLPPDLAFAQVTAEVLGRMGGRYAEIAKQIASLLPLRLEERLWGPLPPRNPHFTGREELLRSLHDSPAGGITVLLPRSPRGGGGEGKSELAAEYVHRFADQYELVCWLPAGRPAVVRATLTELAARLRLPPDGTLKGIADGLRRAFHPDRDQPRWLFVFDGASDPRELLPALPLAEESPDGTAPRLSMPSWSVLITSCDRRWAASATPLEVDVFERSESVLHLSRRMPGTSEAEAGRLAEGVADLPLALEQAAAWRAATGRTTAEYLDLFDRHLRALPGGLAQERSSASLAAVLSLSLERLGRERPQARGLFGLWAFFGAEPVAARLLFPGGDVALPESLSRLVPDEASLLEAMEEIGRLGLAEFDPETPSLRARPLVRSLLEAGLPGADRRRVRESVHAILAAATPRGPAHDETTWARRALVTPHVLASGLIDAGTAEAAGVVLDQAGYLVHSGDFAGAELIADLALTRWREARGPDDRPVLEAARTLADALRGTGGSGAAAALSEEAFERSERRYGPDDPTTLSLALGRGADLRHRGAFEAAHEFDRLTWQRTARRFGPDGAGTTLVAAEGVALDLRLLGRFAEAYDIDREVFDLLRRPAHRGLGLFRVTHQLARDLHGLGRYAEALELQRESLGGLDPALPADHPLVLQARMSHAETLRASGLHEEAERLASSAFESHARLLGGEHPNTLAAQVCLAMARWAAGRPLEAFEPQRRAWTGLRRVLGEGHPFVHVCAAGLATVLRALGNVQTALETDQRALDGLSADPYHSLFPSLGLGTDLYLLGEPEAARTRSADTLARSTALLGDGHPLTLACAHNHLVICAAAGTPPVPVRDPVPRLRDLLGADHPTVRAALREALLDRVIAPAPL